MLRVLKLYICSGLKIILVNMAQRNQTYKGGRNVVLDPRNCDGYSLKPRAIVIHPNQPQSSELEDYFSGFNVGIEESINFVKILNEIGSHLFKIESLKQNIRWLKLDGITAISKLMNGEDGYSDDMPTQLVVLFGTKGFENLLKKTTEGVVKDINFMDQLLKFREGNFPIVAFFGRGIFGTIPMIGGMSKAVKFESDDYPCLSGLAIPKLGFMEMKIFRVTVEDCKKLSPEVTLRKFMDLLGITASHEIEVRGIFLIHYNMEEYRNDYSKSPLIQLMLRYLERNKSISFAGGFSSSIFVGDSGDQHVAAVGFVVIGKSENCVVSTTQLDMPFNSFSNIEKVSEVTKQENSRKGQPFHSFCLMVGPSESALPAVTDEHGDRWDLNWYSNFTKSPIVGFYSDGQFSNGHCGDGGLERKSEVKFGAPTTFFFVTYRYAV